jgi:hypothetical protein
VAHSPVVTSSLANDQPSMLSEGIMAKSRTLRVTRVAPRLRAMVAIRKSCVPMRMPWTRRRLKKVLSVFIKTHEGDRTKGQ